MTLLRAFAVVLVATMGFSLAQSANAADIVRNGGDLVDCHGAGAGQFSGLYALDYLLTVGGSSSQHVDTSTSLDQSLDRIEGQLRLKLPELLPGLREFRSMIKNTSWAQPRVWVEAPWGLVALPDGPIVRQLPDECKDAAGNAQIIQAFVRQPYGVDGVPAGKIVYNWIPSVFGTLETSHPVQLSYLLIHEWLWDYSLNVSANRRLVSLLHSKELESLSREQLLAEIQGMGFTMPATTGMARVTVNILYGHSGIQRDLVDCTLTKMEPGWATPILAMAFSCDQGRTRWWIALSAKDPSKITFNLGVSEQSPDVPESVRGEYRNSFPLIGTLSGPLVPGAHVSIPLDKAWALSKEAKGVFLNGVIDVQLPEK